MTVRKQDPGLRLILAFCDKEAASVLTGQDWLAHAAREWNVECKIVKLDEDDEII